MLTEALSWHWIFFVNLPIGAATVVLARALLPRDRGAGLGAGIDWIGSSLVTIALMCGVYAIVQATNHGWGSSDTLGFGALAALLLGAFFAVEARIANPIMPLRILRLRGLVASSIVRGFLVTGMYSTFFLGTLYLEHIRHLSALQTGLAYLPWTLTGAALSMGLTARFVERFGHIRVLAAGMVAVVVGLGLMHAAGPHTAYFPTVFIAFFAIGLGIGMAFMPLLQIAMADVPAADAGLGSGIVNVSQQISGALGLAVLGTVATSRTRSLEAAHRSVVTASVSGYHLAFEIAMGCVALGLVVAFAVLRKPRADRVPAADAEVDEPAAEFESYAEDLVEIV